MGDMEKAVPKKTKEVLALLAEGIILKFRRTPQGYFKLLVKNPIPWRRFHRKTLLYAIQILHRRGFVKIDEGLDGITAIAITDAGKRAGRETGNSGNINKPPEWDKKWRLILFDVPEKKKKFREAFRYQLRRMNFVEFQRSAFLYPYPCAREIEVLAERLRLAEHVAMITAESISNEFHFKKLFGLL